ncbi:hypothetical protein DICSQDRAFT_175733 [Dichomitus squalens LYAD-421 SS1]|uniref:Uncharacterized protein n=1 Tax=Dichomitus squalens (strain LYAD-421) TaxID=732165 RepID=R7SIM9_DICSQ|nr:uncharacterized protein DICSQDRAFT_175733 [Dichomitus squalens LYAD-421 SS1]EJF55575.1 hypothetical protein DICSQDRAFT_175733 [Dichomitus squalens LYAD-421 SS1]
MSLRRLLARARHLPLTRPRPLARSPVQVLQGPLPVPRCLLYVVPASPYLSPSPAYLHLSPLPSLGILMSRAGYASRRPLARPVLATPSPRDVAPLSRFFSPPPARPLIYSTFTMSPLIAPRHLWTLLTLYKIGNRVRIPVRWSNLQQALQALDFEVENCKGLKRRVVAPSHLGGACTTLMQPKNGIIAPPSQAYVVSQLSQRCGLTAEYLENLAKGSS